RTCLPPVAGIGETIVRAAAIHPDLTLGGVMMRQRKMRRAIAQRLAHGNSLGIERVGDAADRGLRAFLVDVPALEMLDRSGVHDNQRRGDGRSGIPQSTGSCISAGLDNARG